MSSGTFGVVWFFILFFNFAVKSGLCRAQPSGALHLPKPAVQSDGISRVKGTDWQGFKGDAVTAEQQLLSHQGERWGQITPWKITFLVGRTGTLVPTEGSSHPGSSVWGSGVFASSKFPAEGGKRLSPLQLPPWCPAQRAAPRAELRPPASSWAPGQEVFGKETLLCCAQRYQPEHYNGSQPLFPEMSSKVVWKHEFWITAASC